MKRTVFSYPYIVWMLLFIVAPMLFIVFYAFTDGGAFSLEPIKAALSAGYLKVLGHSALIALYTTCICLLLGYPVAYILSKMKKAVAALVSVFFIVPMWMNFLLRTYAWKVLLGAFAPDLLYTEAAVLIGMVYNFLPFMILPIYTVLQKLDKSYIEAARDLGADGVVTFMRVVLPLSVPGIVSGVTMVFVPSITAFAISQLLGGKMTGMLYGDLIYNKFVIEGSQNVGSALSIVLLISVLVSMGVMKLVDKSHEEEGGKLW
jgi:spermidine/putrescine transport system permease protein